MGSTAVSDERARWLARHALPHEPALRAWLRHGPGGLELDDIVQETYSVLAGLESVEQIHNPRAYMFQVARTVILQHLRRIQVVRIDAVEEIDRLSIHTEEPSPEQQASDRQELRQIARLIAGLPAKCREAFTLRKVDGLSQREIARRMGVSEGTVEKHVAKGVRLLMDALAANPGGDPGRRRNGETERHGATGDQRADRRRGR